MKALLFKEFKLAMHPICYVFVFVFPLLILIPSYPIGVGFIYILTTYPILFLGANKGQQSNDLLYSTLLPVRKKDIVLARIITVFIIQFTYIAILSALYPLAVYINSILASLPGTLVIPGIGLDGFISLLGIALIGYSIADMIFFPIYYKKGRSIVMSTLLTILGFVLYICIFTIALPYIPIVGEAFLSFVSSPLIWPQLIIFGGSLIIYFFAHLFVYKVSAKRLEKVDF